MERRVDCTAGVVAMDIYFFSTAKTSSLLETVVTDLNSS